MGSKTLEKGSTGLLRGLFAVGLVVLGVDFLCHAGSSELIAEFSGGVSDAVSNITTPQPVELLAEETALAAGGAIA